ncbi:hypothetical protein VHA_000911 [Grimontia hollisae CIP 101886]|uniref:Uncharacterized protein n=1 Tax=Grimontia hollisae CIP 101886 TaxID=675812 RepID=D0I594_GRIHO|nr:hypothetical protein VHA_000911 [Grimontia hollisae CIP 101886]
MGKRGKGTEFVPLLQANSRTSHIPVVTSSCIYAKICTASQALTLPVIRPLILYFQTTLTG